LQRAQRGRGGPGVERAQVQPADVRRVLDEAEIRAVVRLAERDHEDFDGAHVVRGKEVAEQQAGDVVAEVRGDIGDAQARRCGRRNMGKGLDPDLPGDMPQQRQLLFPAERRAHRDIGQRGGLAAAGAADEVAEITDCP